MNFGIIYFIIFATIMIVIYQKKRIANNQAKKILTGLESEFPNKFKVIGKVEFSKIHKLLDANLNVLHTEDELLISGYDNYRDRQTTFLFYTNRNLSFLDKVSIPKYPISEILIQENENIVIKSGDKINITLHYKKYGKEKPQLKELGFDVLIKKLNKNYLQQRL